MALLHLHLLYTNSIDRRSQVTRSSASCIVAVNMTILPYNRIFKETMERQVVHLTRHFIITYLYSRQFDVSWRD